MVRFLSIIVLLVAFSQAYAQNVPIPGGDGTVGAGSDPSGKIPEPGTLALFGIGVVAVGLISRRRRK